MYSTYYQIGSINEQETMIEWDNGAREKLFKSVTETSIAMNAEYVVVVGRGWTKILCQVGRFQKGGAHTNWADVTKYSEIGYCLSVCLDNDRHVVMVWQSLAFRQLPSVTGRVLQNDKVPSIKWNESGNYDVGYNPTIAISPNNPHQVIEEHETNFSIRCTLHYHISVTVSSFRTTKKSNQLANLIDHHHKQETRKVNTMDKMK